MMAAYRLTDMRTNTAKNIFRICDEFGCSIDTVIPQMIMDAYQPHPVLPDAEYKLDMLRDMLEERLRLREDGKDGREEDEMLTLYINMVCEL